MDIDGTSSSSSSSENNPRTPLATRRSTYRRVRRRNSGKWVCEVREPRKKSRVWLGTFATPEMAAVAHDAAVLILRDDGSPLRFPGYSSSRRLPRAASASHRDVRMAAQQAARDFNPPESDDRGWIEGSECRFGIYAGFVDEEAVFNLPGLINSMAEGMLLTPPAMKRGFSWSEVNGEDDDDVELSLWEN